MTRDQAIRRIMEAFEALAGRSDDSWLVQDKIEDDCLEALLTMGVTHGEMLVVAERALREQEETTA